MTEFDDIVRRTVAKYATVAKMDIAFGQDHDGERCLNVRFLLKFAPPYPAMAKLSEVVRTELSVTAFADLFAYFNFRTEDENEKLKTDKWQIEMPARISSAEVTEAAVKERIAYQQWKITQRLLQLHLDSYMAQEGLGDPESPATYEGVTLAGGQTK